MNDRLDLEPAPCDCETRFSLFMRHLPGLAWIKDDAGRYRYANDAAVVAFQTSRDQLYGKTDAEIFPAATAAQFREHDRQALAKDAGLHSFETLEQSDGVVHQSVISKFAIPRPNGGSAWVGGIAIDVTGQVLAEETVRKTSTFRETIIRTAAEGICVCYPIPDFPYVAFSVWNERMDEITGYSCEEINRLGWYQSLYPDEEVRNRAIERMSRMRVGDDLHSEEWEIVRKGGERRIVAISTSLVEMEGGVENVVGLMLDITDRKRAEEERKKLDAKIQQTQQLESLAVLAGGVAHDFNNLLTTIRGCAELSLMELPEDSPICPMLRDIEEAANQAASLTQQMLAYSGRGQFVVEKVDLATLVRDMGQLMLSAVSKKVVIKPRLETATIEADATQIRQVVMNLIVNAADAMTGGEGVIELRTGVRFATGDELRSPYIPGELPAGRYSFVEVSDNGAGMDALTASRIFEPFFTTKFTGRGLGLAAVLGIVRGHHGSIQVCSEPGKGTAFRVLFPYFEVATSPAIPPVASSPMPRGAGTILVVEDEPSVRHFIQRVLGGAGFTVLTAEDGLQGLDVFSQHQSAISAVLLDLMMPRMDGTETLRQLRILAPRIPVLIMSGYSAREVLTGTSEQGASAFIQKPFPPRELITRLCDVIATTAAGAGDNGGG